MRRGIFLVGMGFVGISCVEFGVEPTPQDPEGNTTGDDPIDANEEAEDLVPDGVPVGGVTGRVCQPGGNGVESAKVSIEHAYGVSVAYTDELGSWDLDNIPIGPQIVVVQAEGDLETIDVIVPENESVETSTDECLCDPPVPCVGLAEAVDRGIVDITLGESGIEVRNYGPHDVCIDTWGIVTSTTSQDAALGEDVTVTLSPSEKEVFPYSLDVYDTSANTAWWCVERYQYTDVGRHYDYNGSLVPEPLYALIHDRTDWDDDDEEDHADIDLVYGVPQTQDNVWDTIAENPIVLVGRSQSLFDLKGDATAKVTIEVRNLGVGPADEVEVSETLKSGFLISNVTPTPLSIQTSSGGTTITWSVSIDPAVPDVYGYTQTQYPKELLTYVLSADEDACVGRCEGNGVEAWWSDSDGDQWLSESEPLIIEHCD